MYCAGATHSQALPRVELQYLPRAILVWEVACALDEVLKQLFMLVLQTEVA